MSKPITLEDVQQGVELILAKKPERPIRLVSWEKYKELMKRRKSHVTR